MNDQVTVFICGRGKRKQGPKFKCVECRQYFESSAEYRLHKCPKPGQTVCAHGNADPFMCRACGFGGSNENPQS